jgi:hypothetical protein
MSTTRRATSIALLLAIPMAAQAQDAGAAPVQESEAAPQVKAQPKAKHGIFPLWGDKVRAKGFDLPEPYGVMVNYYYQRSDIRISNLKLGVNGGPMADFSNLISIPEATTQASALAIRPSLMVLPFFSVYGVFSSGATQTDIHMTEPVDFRTTAKSGAQVLALGGTFQMGYRGFFGVADFNAAVSDVERLADTVGANMLSFRLGKSFKLNETGRGLAVWAGTAGQVLQVETKGSVKLAEVLPPPDPGRVDEAQARCDAIPPQQAVRQQVCNQVVDELRGWSNGSDPQAQVDYSLDKKPAHVWNMVLGAQYALDRNWMFRFEASFLGGRTSFLAGTEYRFDIL